MCVSVAAADTAAAFTAAIQVRFAAAAEAAKCLLLQLKLNILLQLKLLKLLMQMKLSLLPLWLLHPAKALAAITATA